MRSRTKRRRLCAVSRCAEAAAERPARHRRVKYESVRLRREACCGFFREACVVVVRRVGTGLPERSGVA